MASGCAVMLAEDAKDHARHIARRFSQPPSAAEAPVLRTG